MIEFLRQVAWLVKPYKIRLALGVISGVIAGLLEPLMIVTVTVVVSLLFPSGGPSAIDEQILKLQKKIPALSDWLESVKTALPHDGATPHMPGILWVVGAIPLVMLLRGLFSYLNVYFLQWTAVRAVNDLRARLFSHLLNLSSSFFSETSTGELISRVGTDTAALHHIIGNTLQVIIKDPITLISLTGLLLWTQPKLTLISLVVMPACIVPIAIYGRKVRQSSASLQTESASLSKLMVEAFTGQRIIKAYNLESRVGDQFSETTRKYVGHYMRIVRSSELPGPLLEFFGSVGLAVVMIYVAFQTGERANTADFLTLIFSLFSMYRPIKSLVRLHTNLEQARAASQKIFELLAKTSTVVEPARPQPLQAAQADIRFENVDFSYGEKPVLQGINLTVKAGQLVALVGGTGSGKTTLSNLLLRFYDPQRGSVTIGGVDLRAVSLRDLRSQIAVVTQEIVLFNDTIRNNIALGRPGASVAEIEEAARHAHAHEFIAEKEGGYDAMIGEKGVLLSGGQRQRLAIARAIVKDAPILILDEATSSLDNESERAVQAAFEELMKGRTTICIAHRLSTIQNADVIIVLHQGRIVEQGTHGELLQRGGYYEKLHSMGAQG